MRNLLPFLLLSIASCSPGTGASQGPGSATPVADPRSGPEAVADGTGPPRRTSDTPERRRVPVRAEQAPLVHVREALTADSLLGRRVRVAGLCAARGEGRRAGSWTLDEEGATIEVRGLVPTSCAPEQGERLTIFAQIEPRAAGSRDRILLRLPD
ncbi:MAG TPA: hypothetical protein VNO19_04455 [Gemmatimonadales bacterium]|nr:hypothetical protein [Gemmatimonadales bacterium]